MNETVLTTIIVAVATLIASILGALFTQGFKIINDKKSNRTYPAVTIWDSGYDSIGDKIKSGQKARWFLTKDEIEKLRIPKNRFLFVNILPIDLVKMCECSINTCVICHDEEGHQTLFRTSWHIGRLTSEDGAVLPILISPNIFGRKNKITVDAFYQTETYEKLQYSITFTYNMTGDNYALTNRKDEIFLYRLKRYKKIRECNVDLANNTPATVIYEKTKKDESTVERREESIQGEKLLNKLGKEE